MALSFVESSSKNSLAKSAIRGSSSSKHLAISPSWPLTLIMPFNIRCVSTISVFFFTTKFLSERPLYSSLLFSSMIVLNETATSPSAMTMLLRRSGSFDVSRILNNSLWCWSQNWELTHRNLLKASVAAPRRVRFYQWFSIVSYRIVMEERIPWICEGFHICGRSLGHKRIEENLDHRAIPLL